MLCHVLGRYRHALQHPQHAYATSLADVGMLLQGPRSPTSKRNPPTTPLASQLIRQQVDRKSTRLNSSHSDSSRMPSSA